LKGDDLEEITAKKDALMTIAQELAQKAYAKAQEAGQNDPSANGEAEESNDDDNVVDADYEEVD
jgi:molecular chaperone DnaK